MSKLISQTGGFTLPGEAGYEDLTLALAKKWGADVIRDSDGTKLSPMILDAGYEIYATLCIIRDHNEWARKHPETQQQIFLISEPVTATGDMVEIPLMERYFSEQFSVNTSPDAMALWQVYDRTTGKPVTNDRWAYFPDTRSISVRGVTPWHRYTVSFLAFRVWEEINMYNHITNHWTSEHLMQLDPRHPAVQEYLLEWLDAWCKEHPKVNVVRFTSLFYNFAFIWGTSPRNRILFSDWASYDNTVSPLAIRQFEQKMGYALTAEDFVNKGNFQVTHFPPTAQKRDYMAFIHDFVVDFSKKLVDVVHSFGKKAYVFYDDSWVGMEPYGERFSQIGFDGLIKCVFSGFEARLCAHVPVKNHELRLHPYLFPVGLNGAFTFAPGGNPALDAKKYWIQVRRALLRAPVNRIGLGGYLHLTQDFPDFCDYIEVLAKEFRDIKSLHEGGEPYMLPISVAVLHSWGKLRSWSLSGHFHETDKHDLIHINEALSGLPVKVRFLSFEDVKAGALKDVQAVINAGASGTAWSGGEAWADPAVIETLTKWVHDGGAFIGVNEPSALAGCDTYLRMAHVLGVDLDTGEKVCHGRWAYEATQEAGLPAEDAHLARKENIYLTDGKAMVLAEDKGMPTCTVNAFGKGKGIYLTSFRVNPKATRFLLNLLLYAVNLDQEQPYLTDNPYMECAFYPVQNKLAVVNMSGEKQTSRILTSGGQVELVLEPYGFAYKAL